MRPFFSAITLGALTVAPAWAEPQTASMLDAAAGAWLTSGFKQGDIPAWLRRTDVSVGGISGSNPTWAIETIQPLYQTPKTLTDTWFFQGRWARRNGDDTFNVGLGYRRLLADRTWLLGANSFYDMTRAQSHQRIGVGVEAIGQYVTLRSNLYNAFSGTKTLSTSGGVATTERALDGIDYELETPVPYTPWLRFSATGFRWKTTGSGTPNLVGETFLLRGNLTPAIALEVGHTHDNYLSGRSFARLSWQFGGVPTTGTMASLSGSGLSGTAFQPRDLAQHTLDKVRRQNDMIVERKSGGVVIARGN